jgi:formate hydrogenlyase subunit 3/multisubunit Na+/H+ antiporter MnhD subunit
MERAFEALTRVLFILLALALFGLAIAMVVAGCWQLVSGGLGGEVGIYGLMNGVGLLIVSLAIIDVAKFVVEENVLRERELRSQGEARRSLTKFMTIIIIALSLEAVVGIFEAGREKNYSEQICPVAVMAVAVFSLIGLGVFQFLSRRSQAGPADEPADQAG